MSQNMSLLKDLVYASSRAKIAIDRSESSSLNVDGNRAIRESSKNTNLNKASHHKSILQKKKKNVNKKKIANNKNIPRVFNVSNEESNPTEADNDDNDDDEALKHLVHDLEEKIINMLDTAEMDYDFNIKQDCRPVKEFKISYLLKMN